MSSDDIMVALLLYVLSDIIEEEILNAPNIDEARKRWKRIAGRIRERGAVVAREYLGI